MKRFRNVLSNHKMKLSIVLGLIFAADAFAVPASPDFGGRIWNGQDAVPHSAPYMIQIALIPLAETEFNHCGGAILNSRWVLTAAHCATPDANTVLVAGQHDNRVVEPWEQRRRIERIIRHENYCGFVCPYDIALLYVNEPFVFDNYVQPIQLPKSQQIPTGTARFFGWGSISNTTTIYLPNILQTTDQPIIPCTTSQQILGFFIDSTNLCTGPLDGSTSPCRGDSGGPLVQFDENNQPIIIGIASFGNLPCGSPRSPMVYVRVSAFIDWIYSNAGIIDSIN